MKHLLALSIKYIFVGIILTSFLWVFNIPIGSILMFALVVSVAAYFLGDLIIYPRFGNLVATAADFGLYTIAFWFIIYSFTANTANSVIASVTTAFVISLVEALFHSLFIARFFKRAETAEKDLAVQPAVSKPRFSPVRYMTEFADEVDINLVAKRAKKK
ncbi:DUF2512 family protein [Cytobacillus sp. FJAT-54145]|uniref:DUF2512 family protein n=1 Tax=Cytobacillus spartinae TaxID=3299023 RepID=A0ABW6K9U9_9BACI